MRRHFLVADARQTHRQRQVCRPDKATVHPGQRHDRFDLVDRVDVFDLHQQHRLGIGSLRIICRHSARRRRRQTIGAQRRILGCLDHGPGFGSTELTIGTTTPRAPISSARCTSDVAPMLTRTSGVVPAETSVCTHS